MAFYQTKSNKLSGSNLKEAVKNARIEYKIITSATKRQPYIRSDYFKKEKVFFDYFWDHLSTKSPEERFSRIKYFKAAIELIRKCKNKPLSKKNPNKQSEILHRFMGKTKEGELFCVQIKENLKSGKKFFMSCFFWNKKE